MTSMRMRSVKGIQPGDRFQIARTFTQEDVTAFAAISLDYNPVHFDERFAKAKGYKGAICHGLLVASLLTEIGGQMGWLATEMHFRFKKPVYPGDTVFCDLTITGIDANLAVDGALVFTNSENVVVMEATVKGILPSEPERAIIKRMVEEGDPTNPLGTH